jgi:hypothetical protein
MSRKPSLARVLLITMVLACAVSAVAASYGVDGDGHPVTQLATPKTRAIVLVFLASDCPISNRYLPELKRLEGEFARQNVAFWMIYPNYSETAAAVREHLAGFGVSMSILLKPTPDLMALAPATITPESAVLIPTIGRGGKLTLSTAYLGRIDNRYVEIGRERPAATKHDLEQAIRAVLSEQPVKKADGPPVGCGIVSRP